MKIMKLSNNIRSLKQGQRIGGKEIKCIRKENRTKCLRQKICCISSHSLKREKSNSLYMTQGQRRVGVTGLPAPVGGKEQKN